MRLLSGYQPALQKNLTERFAFEQLNLEAFAKILTSDQTGHQEKLAYAKILGLQVLEKIDFKEGLLDCYPALPSKTQSLSGLRFVQLAVPDHDHRIQTVEQLFDRYAIVELQ